MTDEQSAALHRRHRPGARLRITGAVVRAGDVRAVRGRRVRLTYRADEVAAQ